MTRRRIKLDSSSSSFAATSDAMDTIETVTIVGGTHGNEYTGVWCIRAIERQRESYNHHRRLVEEGMIRNNDDADEDSVGKTVVNDNDGMQKNVFEMYPTLRIETLLGNPMAHLQNRRFVDVDLNRQFIRRRNAGVSGRGKNDDENDTTNANTTECYYEATRAREIETLLGKRRRSGNDNDDDDGSNDGVVDVVIDLHTTTANMGITIILSEGYEPIMARAAAHALYRCRQYYSTNGSSSSSSSDTNDSGRVSVQCLIEEGDKFVDLSSCVGKHGITIEVGPVPQGVLRHDAVIKTQVAVNALLEYFHLHNVESLTIQQQQQQNAETGSVLSLLQERLMNIYPRGIVPCYRSSPDMKICWPTTTTTTTAIDNYNANPNFPSWMVHESIQDHDFETVLHIGDPLFVSLDGNTVITYDGSSYNNNNNNNDTEIYPIFVNEGGYYYASSGMGICVATRSHFDLQTCKFVDDNVIIIDDDDGNDDVDEDDDNGNGSSSLLPHVTSAPLPPSPPLRSIGVDYGLVRTGVAVTSGGYSPCPLAILSGYINGTDLSTRIVDIVASERATNVVLGLPLNKNGTASEQSELTRSFGIHLAMEMRKRCGHTIKVVLWDERYTSKEARSRIAAEAMARYRRIPGKNELSGELDADCACIILENYYADEGWLYAEEIRLDEISIQECDIIYARNLELNDKIRLQRLEEQGRRRNARREMIDRDMALTKRLGGVEEDISTKRRKKKRKK